MDCTDFVLLLPIDQCPDSMDFILDRITALVVGPGLSRDSQLMDCALNIIDRLPKKDIPLILDGVL